MNLLNIAKWCLLPSVAFMFAALAAHAEGDPPKPDFEIPKTHIEVRVLPQGEDAESKPVPEEVQKKKVGPEKPDDPMEALRQEMQALRDEMRLLQATLDLMVNQMMADTRAENEFLRKELLRMSELQAGYGMPDPTRIPRPGIDIVREVLESQQLMNPQGEIPFELEGEFPILPGSLEPAEEAPVEYEEEEGEPEPFVFTPIKEWGRSPEMVEELGEDATSLKGMVGIVPPRSRRADIEQLGRDLRSQFDAYDNINIEVFDDEKAAQDYAETQVGDSDHRVLSISKYAASGRDVILFIRKGETSEVAR